MKLVEMQQLVEARTELSKLISDTMTGKFGTKNRSVLITKLQALFNLLSKLE